MSKVNVKIKWTGPDTLTLRLSGHWQGIIMAMHGVAMQLKAAWEAKQKAEEAE